MAWSLALLLVAAAAPVLALLLGLPAVAAAAAPPPMGLPGCPTKCGDVLVPYPFGIKAGCSHPLPGFNLTCDVESTPPRLLLDDGAGGHLQVTRIRLDNGAVHVLKGALLNHTADPAQQANASSGFLGHGVGAGPLALSYNKNKLIALGCNIQARLLFNKGKKKKTITATGCSSFCTVEGRRNEIVWAPTDGHGLYCSPCSGNGCCQAKIPIYFPSYVVSLDRLEGHRPGVVDQVTQDLVLVGEDQWIEEVWCRMVRGVRIKGDHMPPPDLTMVPVVLDFAMNSASPAYPGKAIDKKSRCPPHGASSVCNSTHSRCLNRNTPYRSGYICRCEQGYDGNPYLADGCQDINECENPEQYPCYGECINLPGKYECHCPRGSHGDPSLIHGCVKSYTGLSIGLGIGSGGTVLVLALSTTLLIRKIRAGRKKKLRQRFFIQNHGQLLEQLISQRADIGERMIIPLEELEKATSNFDESRELGGGGHGTVYKGILSSQHVVAIKKAKIVIQREINEFINEVAILSQVNHRNIVKLLGCCLETEVPLLVYEFISNGTLYKHLHVGAPVSLPWRDRLRIAVETARSITYLHSFVSTPIIHRDIKSPNILLDDNLTVKLSDFGASRYIPIDQEGIQTTVQGTPGYLDPMYHDTGHLTEKSDVYSFGVLLIELLTRKKPVSYRSPQGFVLVKHFVSLISEGNLFDIIDPQVAKEGAGEVVDISLLAAICVKLRGEDRPTMRQVEMTLESIQASKEYSSDVTDDDE